MHVMALGIDCGEAKSLEMMRIHVFINSVKFCPNCVLLSEVLWARVSDVTVYVPRPVKRFPDLHMAPEVISPIGM
jgi:hypothetical protein